ncbi:hypothetical protein FRX31_022659 [Thalictrum thalictroides]|uniref:Uncharacterized protein n=1 Tax=Thalictrum thalictroides TaxID=46969 RepID=A0A7J6VSK5_THATH|nr:hypothetical protein FRX31_022659 [Thalictrum thalictroides]
MDLYSDYWPLSNEGLVLALLLFLPTLSLALAVDSCPGLRSRANTSSIPSLFLRPARYGSKNKLLYRCSSISCRNGIKESMGGLADLRSPALAQGLSL